MQSGPTPFDALIAARDLALFPVKSQTHPNDKMSLLVLQSLVRDHVPGYSYLEVGSHLGGTLTPHLLDGRCASVVSIDARPASQPDVRGLSFDYVENSSARMIATIREHAPDADLGKLITLDMDASEVSPSAIPQPPDLILIDGEHTTTAVFRDFLSTYRFAPPSCVFAFHDAHLLFDGLQNVEAFLAHEGAAHRAFYLPDNVFAVLKGEFAQSADALEALALEPVAFVQRSREALWDMIAANRTQA